MGKAWSRAGTSVGEGAAVSAPPPPPQPVKSGHGHESAEEAGEKAEGVTEATSQGAFTRQAGHRPDVPGSREPVFVKRTVMGSQLHLEADIEETSPDSCLSGSWEHDCALHARVISKWPCLSDCPTSPFRPVPVLAGPSTVS